MNALKQHWPECKISWVIGKAEYSLMQHITGVEFIIFDKRSGWPGLRAFKRSMQGRQFDILLHMQAALRSSALALCIPAPVKLGFDRQRAVDFQWLFSNQKIAASKKQHVLEGFGEFARALGVPFSAASLDWSFPLPAATYQRAEQLCPSTTPYLVMNPGTSVRRNNWRCWPAESFPDIIGFAASQGLRCVLSGGPDPAERELAASIAAQSPHPVENLAGKTSLAELLAILDRARMLVAPDTGPAHMAALVNTPVVGLYASSNPNRAGPYRQPQFTVNRYPEALQHYMNKTVDEVKWGQRVRHPDVMALITPADVIERMKAALLSQPH